MQSVVEKCCHKEIHVIPKSRRRDTYEIAPPVAAKRERNRDDVHPGLKKVQPANVRFEVGGEAQHENEQTTPRDDEQFRAAETPKSPHALSIREHSIGGSTNLQVRTTCSQYARAKGTTTGVKLPLHSVSAQTPVTANREL